jgi:uncharacterized HAD superfamily protein
MNIGIDIDGVLQDAVAFQKTVCAKYYKKRGIGMKNPDGYDTIDIFEITKDQDDIFWHKYIWKYADMKPMKNSARIIRKLKRGGHKIFINTKRWYTEQQNTLGESMRRHIFEWFKRHKIPYDEICFAGDSKVRVVKEKKIDVHIEDSVFEIDAVSKHIPVIVFDAAYNKQLCGGNIIRAKNWKQIYRIIQKMKV